MKSELKWVAAALVFAGVLNTAAAPANAQLFQWPWQKHEEAPVEAAPEPQAPPPPVEDVRRAELPAVESVPLPRSRPRSLRAAEGPGAGAPIEFDDCTQGARKVVQEQRRLRRRASLRITRPAERRMSPRPCPRPLSPVRPQAPLAPRKLRRSRALSVPRHGPPRPHLRLARCHFLFRAWRACSPRRNRPQGLRLPLIRSHGTIRE